jgi:hypothetical protein
MVDIVSMHDIRGESLEFLPHQRYGRRIINSAIVAKPFGIAK